jgi:hypothetical protein
VLVERAGQIGQALAVYGFEREVAVEQGGHGKKG